MLLPWKNLAYASEISNVIDNITLNFLKQNLLTWTLSRYCTTWREKLQSNLRPTCRLTSLSAPQLCIHVFNCSFVNQDFFPHCCIFRCCVLHIRLLYAITKSPAIARKSQPYHPRPKPSLRFPATDRKRFVRSETVPCTLY